MGDLGTSGVTAVGKNDFVTFGRGLSAVFLVGYAAIPVLVLIGVLAAYR